MVKTNKQICLPDIIIIIEFLILFCLNIMHNQVASL